MVGSTSIYGRWSFHCGIGTSIKVRMIAMELLVNIYCYNKMSYRITNNGFILYFIEVVFTLTIIMWLIVAFMISPIVYYPLHLKLFNGGYAVLGTLG